MRRSVVVIVVGLLAVAVALLIVGRQPTEVPPTQASRTIVPGSKPPVPPERVAEQQPALPVVEAPRAAIDRYLSDDHLFEIFARLRGSTQGAELWVAHRIAFDCRLTFREDSLIGQVLAGRPFNRFEKTGPGTRAGAASGEVGSLAVTQVIATPAQVDAARELRRRCAGFESMTLPAYRAALAEIDDRLWHVDDAVGLASAIAARRLPATPDRLRTILASQDRVAITLLDEELGERWQQRSGRPIVHALFGAPTPAMQLVGCDLESDCSPTSRAALLGCIDDADGCGLDVHAQLMRIEIPPVQQLVEETRAAWLHAITSGDYAIWGL